MLSLLEKAKQVNFFFSFFVRNIFFYAKTDLHINPMTKTKNIALKEIKKLNR